MMRVLICAYACSPSADTERFGGGELILGWNVARQIATFYDVHVLTHSCNRRAIEAACQSETLPNVRFHYLDLPGRLELLRRVQGGIQLYAYLWQLWAYFVARRLHQQFHFDLFHHVTYANDWMASFIGAWLPIPYIRGPGGGAHRTPRTFLREYGVGARLWENIRAAGQWLFRHDPFFVLGQQRARALLVCNHEALRAIPRKWQDKAQLFPVNGVSSKDLDYTASAEEAARFVVGPRTVEDAVERQRGKFSVLSAGKLIPVKGFGLAIKAFKLFLARFPEAEFTLIGDGPELPRLEALVTQLGVKEQVRIEKWMERAELLSKMRSCDVFLFPSLRDGGGAVVVEAMAAGKPLVCLDLAGPGMHVTNACGIKIRPQFPDQVVREMAAALERLYKDKELRSRMGRAARERAEQVYHWDRLGERMMNIYAEIIRDGSAY
jgi:glycosyltransferase involved in cell wall biosynthesis